MTGSYDSCMFNFEECVKLFSKVIVPLYNPNNNTPVSVTPGNPYIWYKQSSNFSHSNGCDISL